jgi:hypothetical protein
LLQEIVLSKDCSVFVENLDPLVKILEGNSALIPKAILNIITSAVSISLLNELLPTQVLWQDLIRGDLELKIPQGPAMIFYEACLSFVESKGLLDQVSVQVSTFAALMTGKTAEQTKRLSAIIDGEFVNNFDLHLTCLEALGIIALHDSLQRQPLATWFEEFLLDPSLLFANYKEEYAVILKECAAHIMSLILDKSSKESIKTK